MSDLALANIEEIVIAISSANKRVVGVISPEPDELVNSIAHGVADFLARSGRPVLLIELKQVVKGSQADGWTVSDLSAQRNLVHLRQGFDVIAVRPTPDSRYGFADTGQIRYALESLLDAYQFIILELGPVVMRSSDTLNPLPLGAACDYLLLTCRRGIRRSLLGTVIGKLRAARCDIGSIVLNDTGYSSVGDEVAHVASWLFRPLPWVRKRVKNWAHNSELLN